MAQVTGNSGGATRKGPLGVGPEAATALFPYNTLAQGPPGLVEGWAWPGSCYNTYFCQLTCVNVLMHSLIKLICSLSLFCWGADFSAWKS